MLAANGVGATPKMSRGVWLHEPSIQTECDDFGE
jgi:hypothetical protein